MSPLLMLAASLLACSKAPTDTAVDTQAGPLDSGGATDSAPTDTDPTDSAAGDDTGDPGPCAPTLGADLPEDVTWIVLDGDSADLFDLSQGVLADEWAGSEGTYDLNTEAVYGANGFKLERPATVLGAQVRWGNLQREDTAATVWFWPDFSSDGYAFDIWNPDASATACLGPDDAGAWLDYPLAEPFRVEQPLHVFAGYQRGAVDPTSGHTAPELVMEDTYVSAEPYYTGVRFPDVDDSSNYGGLISPWYTWQVRLAVVYDDPPEATPFVPAEALWASARVAWGDYDNDGDADLMDWGPALYRNNGDGTFNDITGEAIPAGVVSGSGGGVWGDYDNDGCLDYFGQGVSYTSGELLLRNNCDGTLSEVPDAGGINDLQSVWDCDGDGLDEHSPTEGAAWLDVDGDGFLDLYLANYECSSEYAYFKNYKDRLFLNDGAGGFYEPEDPGAVGVEDGYLAGRGATTADFDQDGDTDLFISNYRLDRNLFYDNLGDGTLDNVALLNGTQGEPVSGAYGHTIGAAVGDIDNDGDFDLIAANLAHPFYFHFSDTTQVLINDGSGDFADEADDRGIYYRETHSNPTLFDADNDGDLDLFITSVYSGRDSDFYENDGDGYFTLRNAESGLVWRGGWGAAAADHDNDGDVDLLTYELFRNDLSAETAENNWLQVRAVGVGGNTSAIGATVRVEAGDLRQLRSVSGGSGTSSQDDLVQHFGLGNREVADRVEVAFPYGETVVVEGVDAGQRIWVYSDGRSGSGMAPPFSLSPEILP